jgi:hypothetical protein
VQSPDIKNLLEERLRTSLRDEGLSEEEIDDFIAWVYTKLEDFKEPK